MPETNPGNKPNDLLAVIGEGDVSFLHPRHPQGLSQVRCDTPANSLPTSVVPSTGFTSLSPEQTLIISFKFAPLGSSQVSHCHPDPAKLWPWGQVRVDMGQWDSHRTWAVSSLLCSSLPRAVTHQNYPHSFPEKPNACLLAYIAGFWGKPGGQGTPTSRRPSQSQHLHAGWAWEKQE